MKIAMFTSGYMRNPLEDAFKDAKRFGYDGLELWGGRPHAYAPDLKSGDVKYVKELSKRYDMPIIGYTTEMNAYPFNMMIGDEKMRRESIDYVKLSMDMAKEMGADFTLISAAHAGYAATTEQIWDRLLLNMRELTEYADQIDHKLVLEALTPYETNAVKSANDLLEVFRRIPSKNLVGMCDIVPPYVQHESIMDYFDKLGEKMYHMHIIDSDGSTDSHVMPGEGNLPLKELMQELLEIDYQGYLTIELVTGYINEPRLYARRAINNLKALIG